MRKILIIQTAFLGDVILATALVEKLHQHFPDAQLDFLLRKGNESLLELHPHLHKVLIWDKTEGKYKNLWRLLSTIRNQRYDLVVNVQRFATSGFLTAFSGAKQTVGFAKNPFSFLFSRRIPHQIGNGTHEITRNQALIAHLTDDSPTLPRLYPLDKHESFAAARKIPPYICIFPASVWHTKQFPAHKWAQLIRLFPSETIIYLLGSPSDVTFCDDIIQKSAASNVINLCGKMNLLTSAALIRDAQMNYANDSAPLHLASAVNAPIRAVFCSTVPQFGYTPLSENSKIIETRKPLNCRPCGLHGHKACPKGHFDCAETIDINDFLS